MFPEENIVFRSHDIINIIRIMFIQVLQNFKFHTSLMLELFLVPYDLQGDHLFGFMIETL